MIAMCQLPFPLGFLINWTYSSCTSITPELKDFLIIMVDGTENSSLISNRSPGELLSISGNLFAWSFAMHLLTVLGKVDISQNLN